MARIKIHNMEEHRELSREEADSITGGFDSSYTGMSANTGQKTGGNASNYGDINAGSGGAGGNAQGSTYGNNFAGQGGNAHGFSPFNSKIFSSNVNGGAGGNISDIGAQAGAGGAGGSAIGAQGGSVTDNIVTEISIPVTMNL